MRWPAAMLLWALSTTVSAAQAPDDADVRYVSERIYLSIYPTPSTSGERLRYLTTGEQLVLLEERSGMSRVRADNGDEGWVASGYLSEEVPTAIRVEDLNTELAAAQDRVLELENELAAARDRAARAESEAEARAERAAAEARAERPPRPPITPTHWGMLALSLVLGLGLGAWWGRSRLHAAISRRFNGMRI